MKAQPRADSRPVLLSLLALMLAALTSCSAEQAPPKTTFGNPADEQTVAVSLRLDAGGIPVEINAPVPDPVVLSKGSKHTAHWYLCPPVDAKLEIEMKDGTGPFRNRPRSYGKHALSDPPELGDVGKDYRYTIVVTTKDGKQLRLDPVIRVAP
jgi:hypothetical protein